MIVNKTKELEENQMESRGINFSLIEELKAKRRNERVKGDILDAKREEMIKQLCK